MDIADDIAYSTYTSRQLHAGLVTPSKLAHSLAQRPIGSSEVERKTEQGT